MNRRVAAWVFGLAVLCLAHPTGARVIPAAQAAHRSFHEVSLAAENPPSFPGGFQGLEAVFTRPDGSEAVVDGFHAGGNSYKARAYCDVPGLWHWRSAANDPGLDQKRGTFRVVPSERPGKLRIHPDDPYQMQYDNGEWFLHIGDTGYRYVVRSEPHWKVYIDQATRMGATKIRTWFYISIMRIRWKERTISCRSIASSTIPD